MKYPASIFASLAIAIAAATAAHAATKASSITQHHITWTFDKEYPIGQFVNGDWYVIGPVKITAITNDLNDKAFLNPEDEVNGSMINPVIEFKPDRKNSENDQGYDSRVSYYRPELNAARPNGQPLSADNPLVLKPDQSLISAVSWLWRDKDDREEGAPKLGESGSKGPGTAARPTLRAAAVLTCLAKAPPEGTFRPAYAGIEKRLFNVSQLHLDRLAKLAPVPEITADPVEGAAYPALGYPTIPSRISIPQMTIATTTLWLDHTPYWYGGQTAHPTLNMPNYGREMCWILGNSMLALNTDWGKIQSAPPLTNQTPLLINIVQLGIDFAGIADAGGLWPADGGHDAGRKPTILFAGILLDDKHMMNVGHWQTRFQDNEQTIRITEADVAAMKNLPLDHHSPNLFIAPTADMIGLPEWIFSRPPGTFGANVAWKNTSYRILNAGYIPVFALAMAVLPDGRKLFNHEPYFDYADRLMAREEQLIGKRAYDRVSAFASAMWAAHRDKYPTTFDPKWNEDKFVEAILTPGLLLTTTREARWGLPADQPVRINLGGAPADLSKLTPQHVTVTDSTDQPVALERIEPAADHILLHFAPGLLRSGKSYTVKLDEQAYQSLRDPLDRPPFRDAVMFKIK